MEEGRTRISWQTFDAFYTLQVNFNFFRGDLGIKNRRLVEICVTNKGQRSSLVV